MAGMGARSASLAALGAALSFAPPTFATCFDGVRDGLETDVDCGGDCAPCGEGSACMVPRDCASARCGAGQCEERRYESGTQVPNGYHVEVSHTDGAAISRIIGFISLGVGYGAAYAAALSLPGDLSWMYVPVVGPWVEVGNRARSVRGLYAVDGLLQTVGGGLLVGGLVASGRQLVRDDAPFAKIHVVPLVSAHACELFVMSEF
jgi:hypothetical protein